MESLILKAVEGNGGVLGKRNRKRKKDWACWGGEEEEEEEGEEAVHTVQGCKRWTFFHSFFVFFFFDLL